MDNSGEYVYTEAGEAHALSIGQTNRKAGETAMCGGIPVYGLTAFRWLEKGYICKREDYNGKGSKSDAGKD